MMGSTLDPNCFRAKTLKVYLLLLCQMRDITNMSRENALAPKKIKGREIRGLVICYDGLGSMKGWIFGLAHFA